MICIKFEYWLMWKYFKNLTSSAQFFMKTLSKPALKGFGGPASIRIVIIKRWKVKQLPLDLCPIRRPTAVRIQSGPKAVNYMWRGSNYLLKQTVFVVSGSIEKEADEKERFFSKNRHITTNGCWGAWNNTILFVLAVDKEFHCKWKCVCVWNYCGALRLGTLLSIYV